MELYNIKHTFIHNQKEKNVSFQKDGPMVIVL